MPSWPCASARTSQEGQLVIVAGLVEHAPLVRAVTRAAYEAGARYVDGVYRDSTSARR